MSITTDLADKQNNVGTTLARNTEFNGRVLSFIATVTIDTTHTGVTVDLGTLNAGEVLVMGDISNVMVTSAIGGLTFSVGHRGYIKQDVDAPRRKLSVVENLTFFDDAELVQAGVSSIGSEHLANAQNVTLNSHNGIPLTLTTNSPLNDGDIVTARVTYVTA